jgi:hypothetical protein
LYRSGIIGLPTGRSFEDGDQTYHMSFWGHPYRNQDGQLFQIPYMQGFGGNSVVLAPNGMTCFRFADANNFNVDPLIQVAEVLHPFPEGSPDPIVVNQEDLVEYNRYGFSLEHPATMIPYENGLWWQGSVSSNSGFVQFRSQPESPQSLGVLWDTPEALPDLEAFIDQFFTTLENYGITIYAAESLGKITKDGHEILVKRVNITDQGIQFSSTGAVWYCDITHRIYIFYYAATREFASHQDAFKFFQRYFNTFSCH